MNIPVLCVLIAGLQSIFWGMLSKWNARQAGITYDNKCPREQATTYTGPAARAGWAQANSFEAFPLFAAAVILAMVTGIDGAMLTTWSIAYVVLRFAYGFFYIINWDALRSLAWVLAMVVVIRLFVAAI